jgi:SAM-dependent methyltransferase
MSDRQIVFNDGEAYEHFMGKWSLLAGEVYLDWIAPKPGLRWVDVGCGNGAFTELLLERAGASEVEGVDPSDGQLDFARKRLSGQRATFRNGGATALPFVDATFDAVVMALVLFFVPEPEKGVAEMVRVAKPGATIGAYVWDVFGGGFPTVPMTEELRAFGVQPLRPPRSDISGLDALKTIWEGAGLGAVKTRTIEVERVFDSFDDWWKSFRGAPSLAVTIDSMSPTDLAKLRDATRRRLTSGKDGQVSYRARANAVAGVKA